MSNAYLAVQAARADLHAAVDAKFDALIESLGLKPDTATVSNETIIYKLPTEEEGADPRNKDMNGKLTPRGVELTYRLIDAGLGYNRIGRIMRITQQAAKHRKGRHQLEGGLGRTKLFLPDIDTKKSAAA